MHNQTHAGNQKARKKRSNARRKHKAPTSAYRNHNEYNFKPLQNYRFETG